MNNRLDCDRLTQIARHFTGRDDLVVEECADLPGAWGVATHDTEKPVIRLRSAMADDASFLLAVFSHEIGHHVRGHIPDVEPMHDWWSLTSNFVKVAVRNAITPTEERERQAISTGAGLESQIQDYCKENFGRTFGRSVIR